MKPSPRNFSIESSAGLGFWLASPPVQTDPPRAPRRRRFVAAWLMTLAAGLVVFASGIGTLHAVAVVPAPVVVTPADGSSTGETTPDVTGAAQALATVTVFLDGVSAGTTVASSTGDWTFTAPNALSSGAHTARARATDDQGNTSADSNTNTFTVTEPQGLVVTTLSDPGSDTDFQTSLREALAYAATLSGPQTITFSDTAAGGAVNFHDGTARTITLGGDELTIDSDVTIDGPGPRLLAVSGNSASRVFTVNSGKTASIAGMTITGGAPSGNGGGIFNENGATLTIRDSTISGNVAAVFGGGIYNAAATLKIQNSTIAGNRSNGGGVFNEENGTVTIQNSTVTGNSAGGGTGGGIYTASTIPVVLENSIVAGNRAIFQPDFTGGSPGAVSISSNGHNFIARSDEWTVGIQPGDQTFASTGKTLADLLETAAGTPVLTDNGGSTFTVALVPGSPALDAGSDADAVGAHDQRGAPFARVSGTAVDIGAYEAQSISFVVDTTSDVDDGNFGLGELSLREALQAVRYNFGAATIAFSDGTGGTVNFSDGTPRTITVVDSELPRIKTPLNLVGPGAARLTVTVSGISPQGIFNVEGSGSATISGLTISGNGGDGVFSSAPLTVNDCAFSGNDSGIFHFGGALTATACTFRGNSLDGLLADGDTATLTACTFEGNTRHGIFAGGGVQLTATNSTASGNSSAGVHLDSTATATLTNCTVSGNAVHGLESEGSITVRNTLCVGNGTAGTANLLGTTTDGGANLLTGTAAQAGLEVDGNGAPVLQNNGGPTKTIRLLAGSIAIDAGDDALAVDANAQTLTTDQRGAGFPRVLRGSSNASAGARVDIGAFEAPASPVTDDLAFTTLKKAIVIDVLANDGMRAGVTIAILTAPQHGAATVVDGKVRYVPDGILPAGGDTFTYSYDDGHGGTGMATVTIGNFASIAGKYDGLVEDPAAAPGPEAHQRAGYLRLTVSKSGRFSGLLTFAGSKLSPIARLSFRGFGFNSQLGVEGGAVDIVLRRPAAPITLTLQYDATLEVIAGTAASIDAGGNPFSSTLILEASNAVPALAGRYLLEILPVAGPNPTPSGPGKVVTQIARTGAVRTAGRLADGAAFSAASALHADSSFAIYSGLYPGVSKLRGSLRGTMQFPALLSPTGAGTGTLEWFKPARPADRRFPLGFTTDAAATLTH